MNETKTNPGEILTIHIDSFANNGCGVGRYNGLTVFVRYAVPGDLVITQITQIKSNYVVGKIIRIITKSSERIEPDCPDFYRCGGCSFRNVTYEAELKAKEQFVIDAFRRIGRQTTIVPLPILPSPEIVRYRNKAELLFSYDKGRKIIGGMVEQGSHDVIHFDTCLLMPSVFIEIRDALIRLFETLNISVFDEVRHTGTVRKAVIRQSGLNETVLLSILISEKHLPLADQIWLKLKDKFPLLSGLIIETADTDFPKMKRKSSRICFGEGTIRDQIGGIPVQIGSESFFQVNHFCKDTLYSVIRDFASVSPTDNVLDLYCGMGTIGLSSTSAENHLTGCDLTKEAIEAARFAAVELGYKNAFFFCEDAEQLVSRIQKEGYHPDIIITDPPRKGCSPKTLAACVKLNPKKMILVSCSPTTAARDIHFLSENGFRVEKVQPVDMFPRTSHVETVVLMSKVEK